MPLSPPSISSIFPSSLLRPFVRLSRDQPGRPRWLPFRAGLRTVHFFLVGSFLRLVFARSRSCFSDMDLAICLEVPFKLDFFRSPRFAANAAPAAICCFFERAGIPLYRTAHYEWSHGPSRAVRTSKQVRRIPPSRSSCRTTGEQTNHGA
jgi:hypothetical protein